MRTCGMTNKKVKSRFLLLFFFVIPFFSPASAFACACVPAELSDYAHAADHIFIGRVQKVTGKATEFNVVRSYKGEQIKHYTLRRTPLNCDSPFALGKTYLVYSRGEMSSKCGGTKEEHTAKKDEEFLSRYSPTMSDTEAKELLDSINRSEPAKK